MALHSLEHHRNSTAADVASQSCPSRSAPLPTPQAAICALSLQPGSCSLQFIVAVRVRELAAQRGPHRAALGLHVACGGLASPASFS